MTAPVDALAVMRQLAGLAFVSGADEGADGNEPAYRLHQNAMKAYDAVAELIDADDSYDTARDALHGLNGQEATQAWNQLIEAKRRRAAALARCKGEK